MLDHGNRNEAARHKGMREIAKVRSTLLPFNRLSEQDS
jgi:hypothetical protein